MIKCLYPGFEIRTEIERVEDFKKKVPFYRIESFFKVEENSKAMKVFCFGVIDDITDESYIFSNIPAFVVAGLISIDYTWPLVFLQLPL